MCLAYQRHFGTRAQAVVQYKGIPRILTPTDTDRLFELLDGPDEQFRAQLVKFAPGALLRARQTVNTGGAFYLNVGHTDIDLPRLAGWTARCHLRPVYMLHDLIPLTHSEFCREIAIQRHRGRVVNALKSASGIIANSRATKQSLQNYAWENRLRLPPILPAWLSGTSFSRSDVLPFKSQMHFVTVGTIEGRKNHFMLLQVWKQLVERLGKSAPLLVVIGQHGAEAEHVRAMLERCGSIRSHVKVLHHCDDAEMGYWLEGARALLLPSFAEGFGLPLVEAMGLGTPVIASDLPSFREIGQGIPTLIDPIDARSWYERVISYLDHCPDRNRQLRQLGGYRPPTWDDHFSAVEAWLSDLPAFAETTPLPLPALPHRGRERFAASLAVRDDISEQHGV